MRTFWGRTFSALSFRWLRFRKFSPDRVCDVVRVELIAVKTVAVTVTPVSAAKLLIPSVVEMEVIQ